MENKTQNAWERFNIWLFKVLASILPYATSLPVAIMTADRAGKFLNMHPVVGGILAFSLESIGIVCTSLAVEAVIQWIRSKNVKSFVPIVIFVVIIYIYIFILINLNVKLEEASGNVNPILSEVIRYLCYVPMISGVINGWFKFTNEEKHKLAENKIHTETREDQLRREAQEREDARLQKEAEQADLERREKFTLEREKIRIQEEQKTERVRAKVAAQKQAIQQSSEPVQQTSQLSASQVLPQILTFLDEVYRKSGKVPRVVDIAKGFNLDYEKNKGYISTKRKEWADKNNVQL